MKFHNCNASVNRCNIELAFDDGERLIIPDALILTSYESVVCAIKNLGPYFTLIYLLPRWDYSRTTARQVSRFVSEYSGKKWTARELRKGGRKIKFPTAFRFRDDMNFARW